MVAEKVHVAHDPTEWLNLRTFLPSTRASVFYRDIDGPTDGDSTRRDSRPSLGFSENTRQAGAMTRPGKGRRPRGNNEQKQASAGVQTPVNTSAGKHTPKEKGSVKIRKSGEKTALTYPTLQRDQNQMNQKPVRTVRSQLFERPNVFNVLNVPPAYWRAKPTN